MRENEGEGKEGLGVGGVVDGRRGGGKGVMRENEEEGKERRGRGGDERE